MITTEIFTYGDRLILDQELMLLPSSISKGAVKAIGDYCYKNVTLHVEPAEIRTRFFKTRHFIVDIEEIESSKIWKIFTEERQLCCYAAMLKGRKNFYLPSATGFEAPKFIYEKQRKYVFRDA